MRRGSGPTAPKYLFGSIKETPYVTHIGHTSSKGDPHVCRADEYAGIDCLQSVNLSFLNR